MVLPIVIGFDAMQKENIYLATKVVELMHPTIQKISNHVKNQAHANNTRFLKKNEENINPHCPIGVQWMKINTASIGVKNWIC